jgi:hypothetical protein
VPGTNGFIGGTTSGDIPFRIRKKGFAFYGVFYGIAEIAAEFVPYFEIPR